MATTIIAGERRGLKLRESPDGSIRPTQARVRKSLFQRLEPWGGKTVCDLYAGIGSCGIEALSRGAASATFVDNDSKALEVISANINKLNFGESAIINADVEWFLKSTQLRFDVVIADPPYGKVTWDRLFPLVNSVINDGGEFVMEIDIDSILPAEVDSRVYGKSKIALWRKPK